VRLFEAHLDRVAMKGFVRIWLTPVFPQIKRDWNRGDVVLKPAAAQLPEHLPHGQALPCTEGPEHDDYFAGEQLLYDTCDGVRGSRRI
jgi:hypothetical protein